MRIRHTSSGVPDKVELQMTPMIDVVFQLLTFFIFSFKISVVEGDFSIKMPLAAANQPMVTPESTQVVHIQLLADDNGNLSGIRFDNQDLSSFDELHAKIRAFFPDDGGPSLETDAYEVEIEADYRLKYKNTMQAITAVSGYIKDGKTLPLIEKVRFTPPKKP